MSEEVENSYKIRPNFKEKFRPVTIKSLIHDVLNEELSGKQYNSEECTVWSKTLSEAIKTKVKELNLDRYKILVQVVIGEQRGEGVKVACRCLWDSDTDNYAQDIFMTNNFESRLKVSLPCKLPIHPRFQASKDGQGYSVFDTFFCVASVYGVYHY